jgi:hypothetical protein
MACYAMRISEAELEWERKWRRRAVKALSPARRRTGYAGIAMLSGEPWSVSVLTSMCAFMLKSARQGAFLRAL